MKIAHLFVVALVFFANDTKTADIEDVEEMGQKQKEEVDGKEDKLASWEETIDFMAKNTDDPAWAEALAV